jgi:signal peptidase II
VVQDEKTTQGARSRPHRAVFLGLAGVIVGLDQLTKAWLVSILAPGQSVEVVGDVVRLVFNENSGALFGFFHASAMVLGMASLVVIGLVTVYHGRSPRSLYLSISLGLLLGGALGNMIDRLRLGYVVDFVDIGVGSLRWYTFNVADAAISASIVLLVGVAIVPGVARFVDSRTGG